VKNYHFINATHKRKIWGGKYRKIFSGITNSMDNFYKDDKNSQQNYTLSKMQLKRRINF
jgi:CII-binding regulator of phage lambda lysogenization HflD